MDVLKCPNTVFCPYIRYVVIDRYRKKMFSNNAEDAESSGAARKTEVISLCMRLWQMEDVIELNGLGESAPITVDELLDKWFHVEVDLIYLKR